jgi:type IV pilus assembly protein PilM
MSHWLEKINPFSRKKLSVGIQITDDLVRFVAFRVSRGEVSTEAFGEQFLSGDVVRDGKIIDNDRLVHVLRALRKKHSIGDVTVVLPEEQSFVFYTQVSSADSGDELQKVIQDHITSFLKLHSKLSVRDLVCEYDIVGEKEGSYEVQVTTTPKSLVTAYKHVVEESGMHPKIMEVGSHMVSRACLKGEDGQSCLLVDFGDKQTHVAVVSEGVVMESGTIPVGHAHLGPIVERYLNVNNHEAQKILKKYGVGRTHREPELLSHLLHELSPIRDYIDRQFIKWHSREYKNKKQQQPLQKIILHGDGAHVQGFAEHLATSTKIPVEHANVWATQPDFLGRVPAIPYEDTHRYATAISAALRSV